VTIACASWDDASEREAMIGISVRVFVREQHVPMEEEMDGRDPACRHVLARDAGGCPIGTARMQEEGHIGRIAVVEAWRHKGVGARLVDSLLELARELRLETVDLDSQVHAIGFYEKQGFAVRSDIFMDAGIPHRNMVLALGTGKARRGPS